MKFKGLKYQKCDVCNIDLVKSRAFESQFNTKEVMIYNCPQCNRGYWINTSTIPKERKDMRK